MIISFKFNFLLLTILLTGCALVPNSLISLDGSQTDDLSQVALITEDPDDPLLLRGLDGVLIDTMRIPGAFDEYAYVTSAGRHLFWLKSVPYPHPLIPQRIRCYTMHVELAPGIGYRLMEEVEGRKALLLRKDTGETVASGELVDEPWVFARQCRWP